MSQSSAPDYSTLSSESFTVTLDDSVAVVLLDSPSGRNNYSAQFGKDLIRAFELFDRDDRVRAVVVTAKPTAFAYCAGADITKGWSVLWDDFSEKEGEHAHRDAGGQLSLTIFRSRKITIAAVNGHAGGVGMTAMQLPFDLRFAWSGAKLTFPFVRRGISAEATSTYLLPRLVGHANASALLLTGAVVNPDNRFIRDMYYQILPTREEVFPAALAFAKDLAANTAQVAIAYTKGLLAQPGANIEENHLLESRAIKLLGSSGDAAEGARAFKERRLPRFTDTLSNSSSPWYPWWTTVDVKHRQSKL